MHASYALENAGWRKSTFSAQGNCVEVSVQDAWFGVRDSKDQAGPILNFTPDEWRAFVLGVKSGEFDC